MKTNPAKFIVPLAWWAVTWAVLLAVGEIARNWDDWQWWPFWFADMLASAFLIFGAWFALRPGEKKSFKSVGRSIWLLHGRCVRQFLFSSGSYGSAHQRKHCAWPTDGDHWRVICCRVANVGFFACSICASWALALLGFKDSAQRTKILRVLRQAQDERIERLEWALVVLILSPFALSLSKRSSFFASPNRLSVDMQFATLQSAVS